MKISNRFIFNKTYFSSEEHVRMHIHRFFTLVEELLELLVSSKWLVTLIVETFLQQVSAVVYHHQ